MNHELPKIYGIALVQGLCTDKNGDFEANPGLRALGRSQTFFSELYELFLRLYGLQNFAIHKLLDKVDISTVDKKRLEIIFQIYTKFCKKVEESNYIMPEVMPKKTFEMPKNLNLWADELLKKFERRNYIEFEDAQSEAIAIAKDIEKLGVNWNEVGIFAINHSKKCTFIEVLNALKIPTNYGELSENFIQFRIKFEQFLNLCEILPEQNDETALILENLRVDSDEVEEIYEHYKTGRIEKIISHIARNEKIDESEINKKLSMFLNFYRNIIGAKPDNALILNLLDDILYRPLGSAKNTVTIFTNMCEKKFKYLYIPSMIESAFGHKEYIYFISQKTNDEFNRAIRATCPDFEGIIPEINARLDIEKFKNALSCGNYKLTLSTFNYAETKQTLPGVFFDLFKNNDIKNFIPNNSENNALGPKTNCPVAISKDIGKAIGDNATLKLNPSAIANFQSCPKKYYYKNLLKLKERNDFLASYGSVVHAILEVFNRNYLDKYNEKELLGLCDVLFASKTSPENAIEHGFKEIDTELIKATDDMSLAQMRDNFYDATKGLNLACFFDNPPKETHCEQSFEFELPQIKGVIFNGRIDCIQGRKGKYSVIDYKTGKNKKKLEYFASEYGVNFKGDYGPNKGKFNEKLINEYNYQIPVYFLATCAARAFAQFEGKIDDFALEYIRPKSLEGGYKRDFVDAKVLDGVKEKIVQNLREYVVEPIKNTREFMPKPELYKCLNCSYSFLCDGIDSIEDVTDE